MSAQHLYDIHYWFSSDPNALSAHGSIILLVIFVGMIVADIILRVVSRKKKKSWDSLTRRVVERVHNLLITMGVVGLILLLFAYEGIPVLGARYFILLWGLGTVVWACSILYDAYITAPSARKQTNQKGELSKYFRKK